jgi:hypothetical protein
MATLSAGYNQQALEYNVKIEDKEINTRASKESYIHILSLGSSKIQCHVDRYQCFRGT